MADKQPEALRLAEVLPTFGGATCYQASAELRRQHALIAELVEALETCLLIVEHLAKDSAPSTINEARTALAKAKEAQ